MTYTLTMRVIWGIRPIQADEGASLVRKQLRLLSEISPHLRDWREAGKKKLVPVDDEPELTKLLLRGRNRTDVGREVIPQLGYALGWWNGDKSFTAQIRIQCGMYSTSMPNLCYLDIHRPLYQKLGERGLREILQSQVETWSPDAGSGFTIEHRADEAVIIPFLEFRPQRKIVSIFGKQTHPGVPPGTFVTVDDRLDELLSDSEVNR